MTAGWKLWTLVSAFSLLIAGVGLGIAPETVWAGGGGCGAAGDDDADQVCNPDDNCPNTPNTAQTDTDGDGRGDACECGDFNGDGRVNTTDARLIQRCSVGAFPCADLCDVTGDGRCNTTDARIIQRFSVGAFDKSALTCSQL